MSDDSTLAAMANTTPASDAPADAELTGGTIVAERWTIVRFLARGGMGEVYEAHDRLLDGPVALKTLRRGMAHERFVREIQLARKVSHPNVCRIHDAGRHGELSFLTMELLAGESLAERLRRGALPIEEARTVLADLAAALDAAHAAGVIHRDFKPHNVMLVRRGGTTRAMVTDFGIARPADDAGDVALTADGELVGTPAYMAPEQVSGKPITAAADVYSFGVVAYELITGTLPFVGQNARELATARLTEPPRPPRELVKDLDPRWDAAILAALAVDPAARPASASAVLALTDAAPAPARGRTDRASMVLLAAAAAGVLLAAVVLVLLLTGRLGSATPVVNVDAAAMAERVEEEAAVPVDAEEAVDDRALAYEHYEKGVAAFEAKRYDEAITWLLRVDEALRTPVVYFNIAQAYRMKGDHHQALFHYRKFLAQVGESVSEETRAQVEGHIRQIEAALAADGGVAP